MDTWEVNPITLSTLAVTVLTLLGILWRWIRTVGKAIGGINNRMERWDLTAEQHPGLQAALTQQAAAVTSLTNDVSVMARNMSKIGEELHKHVMGHRELTRQVDEIHVAVGAPGNESGV